MLNSSVTSTSFPVSSVYVTFVSFTLYVSSFPFSSSVSNPENSYFQFCAFVICCVIPVAISVSWSACTTFISSIVTVNFSSSYLLFSQVFVPSIIVFNVFVTFSSLSVSILKFATFISVYSVASAFSFTLMFPSTRTYLIKFSPLYFGKLSNSAVSFPVTSFVVTSVLSICFACTSFVPSATSVVVFQLFPLILTVFPLPTVTYPCVAVLSTIYTSNVDLYNSALVTFCHFLCAVTFVVSCVFVIICLPSFSLYETFTPTGIFVSITEYVAFSPFIYVGKLFHVYVQFSSSVNVCSVVMFEGIVNSLPFSFLAINFTVTLCLSKFSHTFSTVFVVNSVFVIETFPLLSTVSSVLKMLISTCVPSDFFTDFS